MESSSCMTIPILLAKLSATKVQVGSLELHPYSPDLAPNLSSKHLSGRKLSSDSDERTPVENWFNVHGRDFYQAGLNKLVQRSDKCLNRFGDYVEK
ncbi:hypothetical protein AVEN_198595-1 [Araneus ventricosus]|uniref:Uncharacterized protein n=1 Tax=Araneus ventricosus TaxID=182803 RepID=A0A4Y2TY59_ARAVE|nr:hypothetical protein AVEN_198595-1 [Araneus ventricosus]